MTSALSADDHRIISRGLALQPFVTGALGVVLFLPAGVAPVMGAFFAITGTLITACVAYPTLRWVLRRRRLTLTRTLVSGAAMGNIPAVAAVVATIGGGAGGAAATASLVRLMMIGTLVGLVSAGVFWAVSGRQLSSGRSGSVVA